MKNAALTIGCILFSINLHAQSSQTNSTVTGVMVGTQTEKFDSVTSEFFKQAEAGQFLVTPKYESTDQTGKVTTGGKLTDSTHSTQLDIEYGFTKNHALSLQVSQEEVRQKSPVIKGEKSGIADLLFQYKGRNKLNRTSSLNYGAYLVHSLEDKKETFFFNGGARYLRANATRGGSSLTPYIGYQTRSNNAVVGGHFMQTLWGTKRTTIRQFKDFPALAGVPGKIRNEERGGGVTELKGFYERDLGKNLSLGADVKYRYVASIKDLLPERKRLSSRMNILGASFGPKYKLGENSAITAKVSYQELLDDEIVLNGFTLKSGNIVESNIAGQISF